MWFDVKIVATFACSNQVATIYILRFREVLGSFAVLDLYSREQRVLLDALSTTRNAQPISQSSPTPI